MLFMQRVAVPCFNCEYRDKNKTIFLKGMNSIDLHIHRSSDPPNYRSTDPLSSYLPIYGSTDYTDHRPCDPLIHRFTNLPIHSSDIEVYQSVDFPIRRKAVVCDLWLVDFDLFCVFLCFIHPVTPCNTMYHRVVPVYTVKHPKKTMQHRVAPFNIV